MTVDTPFPGRFATPWLVSSRRPSLGEITVDAITGGITDVFQALHQSDPGMYTYTDQYGNVTTYRQPEGSISNLPVGSVSGQIGTNVTGTLSSGSGIWILLGVGALFLLFAKKR